MSGRGHVNESLVAPSGLALFEGMGLGRPSLPLWTSEQVPCLDKRARRGRLWPGLLPASSSPPTSVGSRFGRRTLSLCPVPRLARRHGLTATCLPTLADLTQKSSSRPSSVPPPASPQVTTAAPSIAPNPAVPTAPAPPLNVPTSTPAQAPAAASSWGGWGVPSTTSLWGSASAALQQARDAAEALQREGTKAVSGAVGDMASEVRLKESAAGVAEEGRKWTGGMFELVKGVDLHKLS